MSPRRSTVKVGRIQVPIPEGLEPDTAQRLADAISRRLGEIEAASDRIDTQAFALQAALEYAAAQHHTRAERDEETKELLVALDAVATRLRTLADEFSRPE